MNILASYNWIKEYLNTDLSAEDFATQTTRIGNSVEYTHDYNKKFENVVVGEIEQIRKHPNADKLKLVDTKIGKKTIQIVCGGTNLQEGMRVAVALPGAKILWHGNGELVELEELDVRGEKSFGMICSPNELGFEKLQGGEKEIWEITNLTQEKAGTDLAQALGLDDIVFDIEVTSNRPDCMSIIGQAREGGAATGENFKWGLEVVPPLTKGGLGGVSKLSVSVRDFDLCPKYSAIAIDGVKVGPSPWWLQKKILLSGHRPINNIVDITNFVLHEHGQPLHTFDADKLDDEEIIVRKAKKGEKITALDDKQYELDETMLIIADSKKPVAIAGVMGGADTGTTESSTRIILESATFDPVSVRKTSRALNLVSDSSLLFEKGLSVESTGPALARAVGLILEIAGGEVVSEQIKVEKEAYKPFTLPFDPKRANELIGIEIEENKMLGILERLGFEYRPNEAEKTYSVTIPYWRDHDIENSVDFVEEIVRVYGFENIPSSLPKGTLPEQKIEPVLFWERKAKDVLAGAGLTEMYSMSFISERDLENFGLSADDAVKMKNPLSQEDGFMRPSLIPAMLNTINLNQRAFHFEALFEIAPVYSPSKKDIPEQKHGLLIAVYDADGAKSFSKAKGILERLMGEMGVKDWALERFSDASWHPVRSAKIIIGKKDIGTLAEISNDLACRFGIEHRVTLISLQFEHILEHFSISKSYSPIIAYPAVKRDIAFVVHESVEYGDIQKAFVKESEIYCHTELFDIYRGKGVEDGKKSLALHLFFQLPDRTLSAEEVEQELQKIRSVLEKKFHAIMRS
ncbi:MAG: phenylalanine--tRNA ligase subunit beta [Patescibacteria group bacterium]